MIYRLALAAAHHQGTPGSSNALLAIGVAIVVLVLLSYVVKPPRPRRA